MNTKRRLNLINLRNQNGWLQKEVIEKLKELYGIEISESYYGMIEQGVRTPKLEIAIAIAKLFGGVDVDEIFFKTQHNKLLCEEAAAKEVV